ncbi:DDB1- and CUL4-associated factor 1 [Nilaparvata lugens]|uniref:DDB1- and CUL4-associated factor 1 n=1 Tax=Nilaparvata lugens TaxID=108931 RepID=UPI00193D2F23|nr:DDB1- and CUL4-associated factor 1 [Nilaparvata lugens]
MEPNQEVAEFQSSLRQWEEDHQGTTYDPVPMLTRMAELIELESEHYMKKDPDPFDERHPSRVDPTCALGQMLKVLFRKDNFMTKLVNDYLRDNYWTRLGLNERDVRKLNVAACRLILDIMPGLETSAVFETPTNDALVNRLYSWATSSSEPLQTYATGLLAAAMEVQDIAAAFREQNGKLVPLMLERLHRLQKEAMQEKYPMVSPSTGTNRPFANLGQMDRDKGGDSTPCHRKGRGKQKPNNQESHTYETTDDPMENGSDAPELSSTVMVTPPKINGSVRRSSDSESLVGRRKSMDCGMSSPPTHAQLRPSAAHVHASPFNVSDCSNSSWVEMESYVIGNVQMFPPILVTRQIFILKYLTPMGEYQEFLSHVFEKNALELILQFINLRESKHARLAFEALKYLASLLYHKKFSIEFINMNGLQKLLEVPRPSIASTGVSICLYYLAYCEDAMERVCLLPQHILSDLVRYALWLLECSHDSGRCHATMFFGVSFQFRIILEEFDAQDGLRKLYNLMSMLPILSPDDRNYVLNEDEDCAARQIVRHVCVALKRYLEAHLYVRAEQLRRAHMRESNSEHHKMQSTLPSYKAVRSTPEEVREQISVLLELMPFRAHWQPVDQLLRLGGISLLLQVITFSYDWNFAGRYCCSSFKSKTFKRAVRSTPEEVREQISVLLELMPFRAHWQPVDQLLRLGGISLLLQVITFSYDWNFAGRMETVRSALDALSICAVMPNVQLAFCERLESPDQTNKVGLNVILNAAEGEIVVDPDVQRAALGVLITCVCAPVYRGGGCIARYSASGSAKKKTQNMKNSEEIINKVWEVVRSNNGIMVLLQLMMVKIPLTDADSIRSMACEALCGLARSETVRQIISKLPILTNGHLQSHKVNAYVTRSKRKYVQMILFLAANIIAQTRIQFNDKQLFQLLQQHLISHGMLESAATLQREAGLPPPPAPKPPLPATFLSPFTYQQRSPGQPQRSRSSLSRENPLHRIAPSTQTSDLASPSTSPLRAGFSVRGTASPSSSSTSISSPANQPIKLTIVNNKRSEMKLTAAQAQSSSRSLEKQMRCEPGQQPGHTSLAPQHVTLDSIITEYLTNQHALCKNPIVTCPQFNLFEPHKCPDPSARNSAPVNFAVRWSKGINSDRLNQRLVHSRFCPAKTFRLVDEDGFFTCCEFLAKDKHVLIGTHQGDVKLYNTLTGNEEATYQCHESYISNIQSNRDSSLILTSSTFWPLSALWKVDNGFIKQFAMDDDDYVEFSKYRQDKIIGTKSETATIYDITTGRKIMTLQPSKSNEYDKNRATFSPTDELVLSDGVLWDINSGKEIHKLDKLNQTLSGVFHPNGLEVVSNTEVWDLRTFHLLRTVSSLDHCEVIFSPTGTAIYAVSLEQETDEESNYESSFKTLDARDYSSIATIDVKKSIYDLAVNRLDTQILIVENQGMFENVQESTVRLYDVGRRRVDEDEVDDEEEEEELDGSDDNSTPDSPSEDEQGDVSAGDLMEFVDGDDDDDDDDEDDDDDDGDGDDDDGDGDDNDFVLVDDDANPASPDAASDDDDDDDDDDDTFIVNV